jgi:di/tricarboxylate transporter
MKSLENLATTLVTPSISRRTIETFIMLALACGIWLITPNLADAGRFTLLAAVAAVYGWTRSPLPDSIVAIAVVLFLVLAGVVSEASLFAAMGHEIIWLLMATFAIGAVVQQSELFQRLMARTFSRIHSVLGLMLVITITLSVMAFFIPSTSGRAALTLPLLSGISHILNNRSLNKALALLFPTVILLSAGGSLIGAGANILAVDILKQHANLEVSVLDWILLAFPFSLTTSVIACLIIYKFWLPASERQSVRASERQIRLQITLPNSKPTKQQHLLSILLASLAILWLSSAVHGINITIIALTGAVIALLPQVSGDKPKNMLKKVDVELLLFLAATMVIASALMETGAAAWLGQLIFGALPLADEANSFWLWSLLAIIVLTSHLLISSRSARVTVLITALVLPLAAMGHDLMTLTMVTTLGAGFCQTLPASAKPVALFANNEANPIHKADLLKLSLQLFPMMFVALLVFSYGQWLDM